MPNIKLDISYDGADFCGYQIQPRNRTVQGEIEKALKTLFQEDIRTVASGRTDKMVHAYGQVVSFFAVKQIPINNIVDALNTYLPQTIRVLGAEYVSENFNARKDAKKKTYIYKMYMGKESPFNAFRKLRISSDLNVEEMKAAAKLFVGTHDFTAFYCSGSTATTTIRTVFDCRLYESEEWEKTLSLTITANGFLYKMVRLIVGALLQVGEGVYNNEDIIKLLKSEITPKKYAAPPYGLYLLNAEYDE